MKLRTPLVDLSAAHLPGGGNTESQFPVPAGLRARSRWRKMWPEVGSRREQRIERALRPRGLGLDFASDAAGPP